MLVLAHGSCRRAAFQSHNSTRQGPTKPSTFVTRPMPLTANCAPSGEKANPRTPPMARARFRESNVYSSPAQNSAAVFPAVRSHTRTKPARSPLAACFPSGLTAAAYSADRYPCGVREACPARDASGLPVSASHTLTRMSSPTVTKRMPSGAGTRFRTQPSCATTERIRLPVSRSVQTRRRSNPAETSCPCLSTSAET